MPQATETFANLPAATPLTGSELVPLWQAGKTVQTSLSAIQGSASGFSPVFYTPMTSASFSLSITSIYTSITCASGVVSGTITLPSEISHVRIASLNAVSALVVQGSEGQSVSGAPTYIPAGWAFEMSYNTANSTWFPG